jgi:hypothetical protein
MVRWILLLLAVVGVIVGLVIALGGELEGPVGLDRVGPAGPGPRDGGPGADQGPTGLEGSDTHRIEAPRGGDHRVDATQAHPPLVVLVLRIDGSSVPGARVLFLDRKAPSATDWREAWDDPRQREAFIRRHGKTQVADDQGRVTVAGTDSGVLQGSAAGISGRLEWTGPVDSPLRLVLRPERNLRVQVVDHRGRPQPGVRVAIVKPDRAAGPGYARQTEGPEAIATFARVQRVLGSLVPGRPRPYVTFGFPCVNPPRVELDPDAIPEEVVVLKLPPVGSLEVRVVTESGVPLKEVVNVSLGERVPVPGGEPSFRASHNERLMGGKVLFTYVGVGAKVAVKLGGARDRPDLIEDVEGPSQAGEVKRVTLRWTERYPVLLGTAVTPTGQVLAGRRGRFMVWSDGRGSGGPPLICDTQGRFRLVLATNLEGQAGRRAELELYSRDGSGPLEATLQLEARLAPGETDVGQVTFTPKPPLVTGWVRSADGTPMVGVHVRAMVEGNTPATGGGPSSFSATTVGDGSFTIYGRIDATFELVAVRRGHKQVRLKDIRAGSSGIEISMMPELPRAPR